MSDDGWGNSWPKISITITNIDDKPASISEKDLNKFAWDLGTEDKTVTAVYCDGKIEKVYNNKMPTHDPYANPDAQIYYQCSCGAILDPCTKSFAALNNAAMNAGWKIRWGALSYVPYCVECGKDME